MKNKIAIIFHIVLFMISSALIIARITPDDCWPNRNFFFFILLFSFFSTAVLGFLGGAILRIKKLKFYFNFLAMLVFEFFAAGMFVGLSMRVLVGINNHAGAGVRGCFSSLSSNYFHRSSDIFWIVFVPAILIALSHKMRKI